MGNRDGGFSRGHPAPSPAQLRMPRHTCCKGTSSLRRSKWHRRVPPGDADASDLGGGRGKGGREYLSSMGEERGACDKTGALNLCSPFSVCRKFSRISSRWGRGLLGLGEWKKRGKGRMRGAAPRWGEGFPSVQPDPLLSLLTGKFDDLREKGIGRATRFMAPLGCSLVTPYP